MKAGRARPARSSRSRLTQGGELLEATAGPPRHVGRRRRGQGQEALALAGRGLLRVAPGWFVADPAAGRPGTARRKATSSAGFTMSRR